MHRSLFRAALLPAIVFASGGASLSAPAVIANDNRQAAGALKNGILTVSLETRMGVWYPEGEHGRAIPIATFAEEGKAPSTPGPLIRVRVGTDVHVRVRNTFKEPLTVFGFGKTRGMSDSVVVAPNESADVGFKATTPGTFYYKARRSYDPLFGTPTDDQQLGGAIEQW